MAEPTEQERKMSTWNYVVTAHKPTSVSHSCVGYFTSPGHLNLIIAKCTHLEIYLFSRPQDLKHLFDVPIYERIATLIVFRPNGEPTDLLFIATESNKFCVLQWDDKTSTTIARKMGDVSYRRGRQRKNRQIGIVDPDGKLIGLHLYDGLFTVMPISHGRHLNESLTVTLNFRLKELQVLDIEFLFGCSKPTIVVLYQDDKDARHVKTYEVALKDCSFSEGPWSENNLDNGAHMLIPVSMPLGGVIIVGENTIMYLSATAVKVRCTTKRSLNRAYGKVDGFRYLLSDNAGYLHLLVIKHEKERERELEFRNLGVTSLVSTISYLGDAVIYIGSSFGDSQLVKLGWDSDAKASRVAVLERYANLAPIVDLCVVGLNIPGQSQIVTCSGAYKDGSLHIVRDGLEINKLGSAKVGILSSLWSLQYSGGGEPESVLVVGRQCILKMGPSGELIETHIKGYDVDAGTLFCCNMEGETLVQVTSSSVRLICSKTGELVDNWVAPTKFPITLATANYFQVLLVTGDNQLFYLEIGSGSLYHDADIQLEDKILCLDIYPHNKDSGCSMAVVGTSKDVIMYNLPCFHLGTKAPLDSVPFSVLLCDLEGVLYLLCALQYGDLLSFVCDPVTDMLSDCKKVTLGTYASRLRTFSLDGTNYVFAASNMPTLVSRSNKELIYSPVCSEEVIDVCPFNSTKFPDSLAFAEESGLSIGTIDTTIRKLHIQSFPLGEQARHICHQKQSQTFAICSLKNCPTSTEDVCLLNDRTFELLSTCPLNTYEYSCSILSCSLIDDSIVYYCVGTAFALPEEYEITKGRILVFIVEDRKLRLITAKETKGAVNLLSASNGKLLAAINQEREFFKWMLRDDGAYELQSEFENNGHKLISHVPTSNFIGAGDPRKCISLLPDKDKESAIKEQVHDCSANRIIAMEILDDVYLGADNNFNVSTFCKTYDGATDKELGQLEVIRKYHLSVFGNIQTGIISRHGSLVMHFPDSESGNIQTGIFGTVEGMIGVVASLPLDKYEVLRKLQNNMVQVIKNGSVRSHELWRFFNSERTADAEWFLDGDLIETFVDLDYNNIEEISNAVGVPAVDLFKIVGQLKRLH